ncbi:MAG: hypothetical protein GTN74_05060 [Proteobacteria bacterium]|nr:hypothetical protein [Pseudomonadota bacterium]
MSFLTRIGKALGISSPKPPPPYKGNQNSCKVTKTRPVYSGQTHSLPSRRHSQFNKTPRQKSHIQKSGPSEGEPSVVYDPTHMPEKLDRKVAEGGEGAVWTLENPKLRGSVVKVFRAHKLREPGFVTETEQKIRAIRVIKNNDRSMAWPYFPVYSARKQFIGFAMRRVEGKQLSTVMHPLASKPICGDWNRGDYVRLSVDLVRKVETLHQLGIVLGDLNPNNFLVDIASRSLLFVDMDSYQFTLNGRTFRCPVGMPEYTPPEYQGRNFKTFDRTQESDYFAAAVLIFQILMRGKLPFDIVGGEGPVINIRNGNFPYGTSQGSLIPKGNWILLWSHLPRRVKDMFHRAFIDGVKDPSARPNLNDWLDVLTIYLSDARKGWHDLSLTPTNFKTRSYQGRNVVPGRGRGYESHHLTA